jgi:hypothetical protein
MSFGSLLNAREWVLCHEPFPHVRAQNVFAAGFHRELEEAFRALLKDEGLATWPGARFRRNMPGFDAAAVDFEGHVGTPFDRFVSREWCDLFARVFGVPDVRFVSGALHHHAAGSRDGHVHHDLNPGWFAQAGDAQDIVLPRADVCYRTGAAPAGVTLASREMMRAVVIIYYLNNAEWSPGDGGETGLYRSGLDAVRDAVVSVPPINNSLVAFECTPASFHSFRSNRGQPRNSVIIWLHREKQDVLARWGASAIVPWH